MVPEGLRHAKDGRIGRTIGTAHHGHHGDVGAAKVGTFHARKRCVKKDRNGSILKNSFVEEDVCF